MGILDLISARQRAPAECIIRVDGEEISGLYPFLTQVRVECSRREASVATLELESRRDEQGRWSVQDAGIFEPWKAINIEAAFGATTEEVMRGYVREIRSEFPQDAGMTKVTVECQDDSLALDREEVRTVWGGDEPTDDRTIVAAIAAEHDLELDPEGGSGLSNLVLNQSSTAVRFLRQRAEANGYELIFRQGSLYFGPLRLEAELQERILVYAGADTNCIRFSVREDGHLPDQVAFDVAAAEGAASVEQVVESDLPLLGPEPARSGSDLPELKWRLSRPGKADEEQLRAAARQAANDMSMKVKAEGELDGALYGHVLRCAEPVPVDGVGARLAGSYYVDTVTHLFTTDGYRQSFQLLRNAYGDNINTSGSLLAGIL